MILSVFATIINSSKIIDLLMKKQIDASQRFKKARLTIQDCSFPRSPSSPTDQVRSHKKISFAYLSSSLDKKHKESSPENSTNNKITRILKPERKSEPPIIMRQVLTSQVLGFPEIRTSRTEQKRDKNDDLKGLEPLKSFSSSKLTVNPYHKIESIISTKYCSQMAEMKLKEGKSNKIITISQLNSGQISSYLKEKQIKRALKKTKVLKGNKAFKSSKDVHLPGQLMSNRYEQKLYDNNNFNLQLKNVLRFEFDSNLHLGKPKSVKKEDNQYHIEGWKHDHDNRTPVLYMF